MQHFLAEICCDTTALFLPSTACLNMHKSALNTSLELFQKQRSEMELSFGSFLQKNSALFLYRPAAKIKIKC